jgi:outer membrane protein
MNARRLVCCTLLTVFTILPPRLQAAPSASTGAADLSLDQFLALVLARNETIQVRLLEFEASRRKARAEHGVFEPEAFASYTRQINKRKNTVLEQSSELGALLFNERNNIYEGGVEGSTSTGARIRLGYTLSDLHNNLQSQPSFFSLAATNGEYETFFGLTLTQPLLKNAWFSATLAGIRLAALDSDIAFQDYRKQMMLIISTAEAAYWDLYFAQEQVRAFQESVATAQKILRDAHARVGAGTGAEIDVLEAQAGLALRQSKLSEAEAKLHETADQLMSLYSESVVGTNRLIRATDRPRLAGIPSSMFTPWRTAYDLNPEYLMQRQKVMQEYVRVAFARNQRLPELNLKGSYGLNGLGDTPGASWNDIEARDFPSWSFGIELRVPLWGGIKAANELAAAKLRQQEAIAGLREIETQMANGIDTALRKLRSARDSVQNYKTVTNFNQKLLDSALQRLEVGKLDARKVLEIEADLLDARNSEVEALVNCQRALLQLEVIEGSILKGRHLDETQKELGQQTEALLRGNNLQGKACSQIIREAQLEYHHKEEPWAPDDTPAQQKAREAMRASMERMNSTSSPAGGDRFDLDSVLRRLRQDKAQESNQ